MIDPLESGALRGLAKVWRRRAENLPQGALSRGILLATEKCAEELEGVVRVMEEDAATIRVESVGDGLHWPGTT